MGKIFDDAGIIIIKNLSKLVNEKDSYKKISEEIENLDREKINDYLADTRAKRSYIENEINIFAPSASFISVLSTIITLVFGFLATATFIKGLESSIKNFIMSYIIILAIVVFGVFGYSINYTTKLNKQVKYLTYIENKLQFKKD